LVDLGQILARVVSLKHVLDLSNKGFSPKLIDGATAYLRQEMQQLLSSFSSSNATQVIEDYQPDTDWLAYASR